MPPQAFVVIYLQENFMKKLLALILLVLTVALSFTSCAKAEDIGIKADNAASMLEFNFYETLKITSPRAPGDIRELVDSVVKVEAKDKNGDLTGELTIYSCKDEASASEVVAYFNPEDAETKRTDVEIYNSTKVIVGKAKSFADTTLPEGVGEIVEAKKLDKNGAVEDKITIYYCDSSKDAEALCTSISENNTEGLDVGMASKRVYIGTKQALTDATVKNWFNQLYHTFVEDDNYMYIVKGIGNTLLITVGALLIGVILGVSIAIAKYYAEDNPRLKIVNFLCDLYTTVIRGIPVTVLLLIFFFIILVSAEGVVVAIIAFGINSGAYMAELVRSGINAVDKGQMEAARSLGMSKWQAMKTIILPQAVKNILPAIGNECIALLKETSVAGYVAVVDLTRGVNLIRNNTYDAFNPLMLSALIYLAMVIGMTQLLKSLERRLQKSERRINK